MAIHTLLFDLDGTLTDSQEGIVKCLQHALRECGHGVPNHAELMTHIGPPLPKIFETLIDSEDSLEIEKCVTAYRERFSDVGKFENKVYDGIDSLLRRLNGSSDLYVATSKPQVFAKQILEHFNLSIYFKSIYGSNLDNTLSNKTELLAHIIKKEGLNPDETLMVGDRSHDIIGAIDNGITPVGVLWGYGDQDELISAGCVTFAGKPSDIIEFL